MIEGFIIEEKGQATLEYILTIGMIILATVVTFAIYGKMGKAGFEKINASTDAASSIVSSKISAEVADVY